MIQSFAFLQYKTLPNVLSVWKTEVMYKDSAKDPHLWSVNCFISTQNLTLANQVKCVASTNFISPYTWRQQRWTGMRYRGPKPFSGKRLSVQGESQDCCSLSAIHSEAFVICNGSLHSSWLHWTNSAVSHFQLLVLKIAVVCGSQRCLKLSSPGADMRPAANNNTKWSSWALKTEYSSEYKIRMLIVFNCIQHQAGKAGMEECTHLASSLWSSPPGTVL